MPIYEYHCQGCGQDFEVLVMGSRDKVECPSCRSKKVGRLMSGFAHKCEGKMVSSGGDSCSSCSSGNCSTCH
jgi:putative FmdB family regulatory protein